MTIVEKYGIDIDSRVRSLLQKAVRRGNLELVYTTCALIQSRGSRERNWLGNRAAIITFEDCWPLGAELAFNKSFHSKAAVLVKVARAVKTRDAAGLGSLAYRLFNGDSSVLDGTPEDRHIKIIAHAIRRPEEFWHWLDRSTAEDRRRQLVKYAIRFKTAGRSRDRAVVQAAAYLAGSDGIPEIKTVVEEEKPFPYWVALDGHTSPGKRALRDLARDLHVDYKQLEWAIFFFEGSAVNATMPSPWWNRNCAWRFRSLNLQTDEAHLLWDPIRPQWIQALAEDSRRLHRDLYNWKLANRERIETLKKQIDFYITHFDTGRIGQLELF